MSLCTYCKKNDAVKVCGQCTFRLYCSEECSQHDWPMHRLECGMWTANLEKDTTSNSAYRRVLWTTGQMQMVLMYLRPGEEIGQEVHRKTTQFIRVEKGTGSSMMGQSIHGLKDGSAIMVPAGVLHNIWADDDGDGLWLYTLYSPPQHKQGLVEETKP